MRGGKPAQALRAAPAAQMALVSGQARRSGSRLGPTGRQRSGRPAHRSLGRASGAEGWGGPRHRPGRGSWWSGRRGSGPCNDAPRHPFFLPRPRAGGCGGSRGRCCRGRRRGPLILHLGYAPISRWPAMGRSDCSPSVAGRAGRSGLPIGCQSGTAKKRAVDHPPVVQASQVAPLGGEKRAENGPFRVGRFATAQGNRLFVETDLDRSRSRTPVDGNRP